MPMPPRMPWDLRFSLAWKILTGQMNSIGATQTPLLYEVKLRNRNKEWYANRDAGRYPFYDADWEDKS